MTEDRHEGACFCGAVKIAAEGTPLEMGYCHCSSCRSYSGAPLAAFTLWRADQVRVVSGADKLGAFNKAGFSNRRYCTACGGHLFAEHPSIGLTDVLAGALPSLDFRPAAHLNYAETVLPMKDGLPKLKDLPAHAGGSGELLSE